MLKKLKKINPFIWIGIIAVLFIGVIVLIFWSINQQKIIKLQAQEDTTTLQAQIQSMYRGGYVAVTDIRMGEMISETNVIAKNDIVSTADPSYFITADDIGKIATVDILSGTPVFKTEVSEDMAKDLTERQCNFIYLNGNTTANDYVDVRIMFPNGEDMVIVSKTPIKSPQPLISSCYLWLTETENDLLSAAIVDANLNGAKLYINKYVKPEVEEPSTVTYQPNSEVIALMQSNPDVLKEAEASLSASARQVLDKNLKEFWESNPDYVIKDEIVEGASNQTNTATSQVLTPSGGGVETPTPDVQNPASTTIMEAQ